MIGALLAGIGLGLSLSVAAGPVFILLVDTSLEKGKKLAVALGAGVWLSDAIFAFLTYIGVNWVSQLAYSPQYKDKISFIGALILFIFGVGIIMDSGSKDKVQGLRKRDVLKLFAKGFLLNTFNPFTIVFWLGISGGIVVHQISTGTNAFFMYGGLLGTVVLTDVLKIVLAEKVALLLKSHIIDRIRKIAGIILILCSFALLYNSFF